MANGCYCATLKEKCEQLNALSEDVLHKEKIINELDRLLMEWFEWIDRANIRAQAVDGPYDDPLKHLDPIALQLVYCKTKKYFNLARCCLCNKLFDGVSVDLGKYYYCDDCASIVGDEHRPME